MNNPTTRPYRGRRKQTVPFGPLEQAALAGQPHHLQYGCTHCNRGLRREGYDLSAQCVSDEELAERLGCSKRSIGRWRAGQELDLAAADVYATRIGSHIEILWPELQTTIKPWEPPDPGTAVNTTMRIPVEVYAQLVATCEDTGLARGTLVAQALTEYFARMPALMVAVA